MDEDSPEGDHERVRFILSALVVLVGIQVSAQVLDKEAYRSRGYEAMVNGELQEAIDNYSAILAIDSSDYDARLALGRLHFRNGNCDSSMYYYRMIYRNDRTDVEALNGFVRCFIRHGKMDSAIHYAERAVNLMPNHVPEYLQLAKALSYDGQLDRAIEVYRRANKVDNTWSQVWAGLGRMHYWKAQPATAIQFYEKALDLDPKNTSIREEYENIKNALAYNTDATFQYIQETEPSYQIDAIVQQYSAQKRVTDHIHISANILFDYSSRDYTIGSDTTRWYDNSWIKTSWITDNNRVILNAGASRSDSRITSYGLSWQYHTNIKSVKVRNILSGGYSYFYYWNEVGRNNFSDNLSLEYSDLSLSVGVNTGTVDEKQVRVYSSDPFQTATNPYFNYSVSLTWQMIDNPQIKLGANHSYYDYKYNSPAYYTPTERLLTGPSVTMYYDYKKLYTYGRYAINFGSEKYYYVSSATPGQGGQVINSGNIDTDNWSASLEIGYSGEAFSLAAGASRFYNPYYENLSAFITLSAKF
ncbi:MAG: tetratricopeptide repeat protein [Candidatus Marinimicrobia bacterium]|nr:tetratricopeptide repeat protein [Candidatus Neomarinimicrobiota bacterium]MCF7828954.1 tetratricopeptide repeat protein [Candidatus Neomarinimicrobiota bacterium]MCF7879914.1 tetratricopeptide repeat protein [Candidatus Neomarinimicrobiota bacterium]